MTVSPPDPGSSGKAHRNGWVVEKTNRPPGRSTRAASRISPAESATKGTAPYAVNTASKLPAPRGRAVPSHWRSGTAASESLTSG